MLSYFTWSYHFSFYFSLYFFSISRPPKKNFVEVTELTDITYTSNLVKLRPGHINVVLVLTDATKNILLSKFAKEVYSFTGWALNTCHTFAVALSKKKNRLYYGYQNIVQMMYFQDICQVFVLKTLCV